MLKRGIFLIILLLLVGLATATDIEQVATYAQQYEDGTLNYLKFKTYLYSVEEQFYDEMEDQMERVDIDHDDSGSDENDDEIMELGKQAEEAFFDRDIDELKNVVNSLIDLFEEIGDDYAVEVLENIYAAAEEEDWEKIEDLAMKLPKMGPEDDEHGKQFEGFSQEFVEDLFGEPSGYEKEIWAMNDDEPIYLDEPVPFYQKSLYKGSKVKITLNAWPSAINDGDEIILFYHIGFDTRLNQEGSEVDIDEVVNYIKEKSEAYQNSEISLEELAIEAAQQERKVHDYLWDNEEDCDEMFSGLLSRKEESEITYFEGTLVDNNNLLARISVENRVWENEEGKEEENFNFWTHIESREKDKEDFMFEHKEMEMIDTWGMSGEDLWEEFSEGFVKLMQDIKDADSAKEAHEIFFDQQNSLNHFLHEATWRAVSGESDMTTSEIKQGMLDLINQEAEGVIKETADRTDYKEYLIKETVQQTNTWCRGEEDEECDHGYYCEDAACVSAEGGNEVCDNGEDDDDDTYWDCEDPDCDCDEGGDDGGWFGDGDWSNDDNYVVSDECRSVGALSKEACEKHNSDVESLGPGCGDCESQCPSADRTDCVNDQCECYYDSEPEDDNGEDNPCNDCESYCGEKDGKRLTTTNCVNGNQCECNYEDIKDDYEEEEEEPKDEPVEEEKEAEPEEEEEPKEEEEDPEPEPEKEEPAEEPKEDNGGEAGIQMITAGMFTILEDVIGDEEPVSEPEEVEEKEEEPEPEPVEEVKDEEKEPEQEKDDDKESEEDKVDEEKVSEEPKEEEKEKEAEEEKDYYEEDKDNEDFDWFSDVEDDNNWEEWTNPCQDECEVCWECDWENNQQECNEYCITCNLCEYEAGNLECHDNQQFNEEWAFCECELGYGDCDGDWLNGCEFEGQCEGCQSDTDCAEDRCSDDRRRITSFTCEQDEGWEQDKNVLEIGASCNLYSGGRTETHFWISGWGEDLNEFDKYKREEQDNSHDDWCMNDLDSLIEERLMIQEAFTEEYMEWFFNEFVDDDPTKFEEHMRIIHSLHRILMDNTDRTAWALSCLGEEDFPTEYVPIEISYESTFGNIEIWEEFKKTDHFGEQEINVLNPYMKVWIFPPKEFIIEKMKEEMDGPKGPPAHEIEDIKGDEDVMEKINKISDRFDGGAEIIFQIEDEGEIAFQGLMEINPDIIMKIERVENYDGVRDATMSVEFDFLYNIMSTVAKEVEGEHVEGPWWEDRNKHNGGGKKVKDGWVAVKIVSKVILGLTSGDIQVDPGDKLDDIVLSLKDMVTMMSMGE